MLPTIGLMIGFYIIARAIEMFCKDYKGKVAKVLMYIVAIILIFVTGISMFDLYSAAQGPSHSSYMPSF